MAQDVQGGSGCRTNSGRKEVHHKFVPAEQTINGVFYVEVLKRLKQWVNRVRKDIAADWLLHHDNAPSHTCLLVHEHLAKNNLAMLPQPPYSRDLSPADFFLFLRIKGALKGRHFGTVNNMKEASTRALKVVPQKAFEDAYQAWQSRWQKCVDAQGSYFEKF